MKKTLNWPVRSQKLGGGKKFWVRSELRPATSEVANQGKEVPGEAEKGEGGFPI